MKKHLILLALLLNAGITMAQKELSKDYSYTVSNPYEVFDAFEKNYFSKNDQILTVKIERKEILIQKFDAKGQKIVFKSKKLYELKKIFPKNFQLEEVKEVGNKFYLFYSSWDGDNDTEQLFAREIDFDKGEFIGDNRLVVKVDGKVTGGLASVYFYYVPSDAGTGKFNFVTSKEGNKVLVRYRKKPEKKLDTKSWDVIGLCVMDENLNISSQEEIKMPYTERRMDILDYAIDAEANSYALVKVYHDDSNENKKKKKDKVANYHIELFRVPAGSKEIDITKIELKDNFINTLALFEGKEGSMVCAGFYNKGINYDTADGIITFKVHKEGGFYDMFTHEIPEEIIKSYLSEKQKKKVDKKKDDEDPEFPAVELRDLVINEDGSIVLVSEQFFTRTFYTQKSSYTRYYYYDILISKIDAQGNLSWIKRLPKRQIGSQGRGGMSFKYINANNYHYVLFLDNVKNHNLTKDEVPAVHTDGAGGYFTSYKINDADGSYVNSSVFNVRDIEEMTIYQFATSRIVKVSEDDFALEVYKKKKEDVMIKVHIN
ncbi:hypothetical protein [Flavobacterium alkalisoli]|uniref:hypothetical protein n=1 Tax=Flavobacterium alkalisoli TaxID=2602769 RepID=UPI003A92C9AE